MKDSIKIHRLRSVPALLLTVALIAGCATRIPAPVSDGGLPPSPAAASNGAAPSAARNGTHVVRPGETLLAISRQYGHTVAELVAWNGLSDPNQIQVGQALRVAPPAGTEVRPIASNEPVTVQPVTPPNEMAATPIKQEPRGGKQPYSDEAWAAVQRSAPGAEKRPETTPATPQVPENGKAAAGQALWLWPAGGKLIASFNEASNKGIDISGTPGDSVVASAAGKVVYAGSGLRGYGKLVIIKHDESYLTAYAHNQQLLVKEGDTVAKGQKIAELGSTDADRPKLHFEIRKQGRPVDPLKYLPTR